MKKDILQPLVEPMVITEVIAKPVEPLKVEVPLTEKEIGKQRWKDLEVEERRMVKGKFILHECPNGEHGFSFKKFKSDPLKNYSLKDGETYELPLSVARHLNNNVSYPSYKYKNDEAGRPTTTISEMIRRTSFQSLEFF